MRLIGLSINNYKSLKNVDFSPKNLSILVGPNAAGKSNFIDALDFLASIYRYGIENAISMKGGYENIAFRKHRRTKAPISFEVRFMGPTEFRELTGLSRKFLIALLEYLDKEKITVRVGDKRQLRAR